MCESRLLHFEIAVLQFENLLEVLPVGFCTSKVYILHFENTCLYFESIIVCSFCTLKETFDTSKVYLCTSKVSFCSSKIHFCLSEEI